METKQLLHSTPLVLILLPILLLTACTSKDRRSANMAGDDRNSAASGPQSQAPKRRSIVVLFDKVDDGVIDAFNNLFRNRINGEEPLTQYLPDGYASVSVKAYDLSNSSHDPIPVSFLSEDSKADKEHKASDFIDSLKSDGRRNGHSRDKYILKTLENVAFLMNDPFQEYTLIYYSDGVENSGAEIGDIAEKSGWQKGFFSFISGDGGCNGPAIQEARRQMEDSSSWMIPRLIMPSRKSLTNSHVKLVVVDKNMTMNPGNDDCKPDIRDLWTGLFRAMGLGSSNQHANSLAEAFTFPSYTPPVSRTSTPENSGVRP